MTYVKRRIDQDYACDKTHRAKKRKQMLCIIYAMTFKTFQRNQNAINDENYQKKIRQNL